MLIFGQPHIEKKEISEVLNTLKSGWLGTGPKVQKFEKFMLFPMIWKAFIALMMKYFYLLMIKK